MENYVTLFDSLFLPQGLALYLSLERHAGPYRLWIICMDSKSHEVLTRLALPNVRLILVDDVETDALRNVKPERSKGEYCWTLTPFVPKFVFDADSSVARVTYLDADLWFRDNPAPIFQDLEHSGKKVLITDHAYAPEYDQSHKTGRYCVQFVTFTRDDGEPVRLHWEGRCIEWCFARSEPGRFGDQKYLDIWPIEFPKIVHVSNQKDSFQAPWNAKSFPPSAAVTFHFHGLRLMAADWVQLTDHYNIPRSTYDIIYRPYLEDLLTAIKKLQVIGHQSENQTSLSPLQARARAIALRLRARWNEWTRPDIVNIYKA